MTTILLIFGAVVLFFIGLICPHLAGKIQHKTDSEAHWLKRMSNWLWDPLTWWAKTSIESTRKVIDTVTQWGKNVRKSESENDSSKKKKSTKS
ncbi:MAG: hypothetical protein JWN75_674 [Candidatus Saccharibacteria bacterium]|nr:hypothetical protein [Candidatus Saccharibacteria bacterium]